MDFSKQELARYARHFALPDFGIEGQRRLKNSSVLVIGAGGLGSPMLLYLAAAGVGRIGIVDPDVVDMSNLQRQVLYTVADIGKPKAETARKKTAGDESTSRYSSLFYAFESGKRTRFGGTIRCCR